MLYGVFCICVAWITFINCKKFRNLDQNINSIQPSCMIKIFMEGRGGGRGGSSSERCLKWDGGGEGVIKGSFQKHLKMGG